MLIHGGPCSHQPEGTRPPPDGDSGDRARRTPSNPCRHIQMPPPEIHGPCVPHPSPRHNPTEPPAAEYATYPPRIPERIPSRGEHPDCPNRAWIVCRLEFWPRRG